MLVNELKEELNQPLTNMEVKVEMGVKNHMRDPLTLIKAVVW